MGHPGRADRGQKGKTKIVTLFQGLAMRATENLRRKGWNVMSVASSCRRLGMLLLASLPFALSACESGGHFNLLGYTSRPMYDPTIRTVRLKIFGNETMRQRLEFDLTEAVVREIESKTPFKVVMAGQPADTELVGKIINWNKSVYNVNRLGLVRASEVTMSVELRWRDLRGTACAPDVLADPLSGGVPPTPVSSVPADPAPIVVQARGEFRPELGESIRTAEQEMVDRMAVQIISMMEHPW